MRYLTGIVLIAVDIFPVDKCADYRNPAIFNELSDYFLITALISAHFMRGTVPDRILSSCIGNADIGIVPVS